MNQLHHRKSAFTLIELLVVVAIILVLAGVAAPAVWGAYKSSSLAVSANNIRQLAAGGAAYLGDNNYRFWPYLIKAPAGDVYWFGLEPAEHRGKPEGERIVDMQAGPLGAYKTSSLAVSANNIRQLAAGGAAYLGDNNYRFWPYRRNGEVDGKKGAIWWFGFEPGKSLGKAEGERTIDMEAGPLGAYMPRSFVPDPSFGFTGKPFKPKYKFGYIGVGYNVHLAGETKSGKAIWLTRSNGPPPLRYWDLEDPANTVVFATSAQVYPFREDAVIEEFYGIDNKEVTVHFRHNGQAMVAYANGSAGLLPMDPSTRDAKAPEANVGRFAPKGSKKYLR